MRRARLTSPIKAYDAAKRQGSFSVLVRRGRAPSERWSHCTALFRAGAATRRSRAAKIYRTDTEFIWIELNCLLQQWDCLLRLAAEHFASCEADVTVGGAWVRFNDPSGHRHGGLIATLSLLATRQCTAIPPRHWERWPARPRSASQDVPAHRHPTSSSRGQRTARALQRRDQRSRAKTEGRASAPGQTALELLRNVASCSAHSLRPGTYYEVKRVRITGAFAQAASTLGLQNSGFHHGRYSAHDGCRVRRTVRSRVLKTIRPELYAVLG